MRLRFSRSSISVLILSMLRLLCSISFGSICGDGLVFILSNSCKAALRLVTGVFKLVAGNTYKIIFLLIVRLAFGNIYHGA
jgi:hypothetical protein